MEERPSAAKKRLFFALWPTPEARALTHSLALHAVAESQGRPVHEQNLHLTLAFLHYVETTRLDCIGRAARRVQAASAGFSITLDRLGYWPRSRILFAAPAEPPAALGALEQCLWRELADCDFIPERRAFQPHVTLARQALAPSTSALPCPVAWSVDRFALVESITGQRVPSYHTLASWTLGDPQTSDPVDDPLG